MAEPSAGTALSMEAVHEIFDALNKRQENFPDEDAFTTLALVLLNIGERYRSITCTEGEWIGKKRDLESTGKVPTCPNGHRLYQAEQTLTLGWVLTGE